MITSFSLIVPVLNKENEIIRTLESIEASINYFYEHHDATHSVKAEVVIVDEDQAIARCNALPHLAKTNPITKSSITLEVWVPVLPATQVQRSRAETFCFSRMGMISSTRNIFTFVSECLTINHLQQQTLHLL